MEGFNWRLERMIMKKFLCLSFLLIVCSLNAQPIRGNAFTTNRWPGMATNQFGYLTNSFGTISSLNDSTNAASAVTNGTGGAKFGTIVTSGTLYPTGGVAVTPFVSFTTNAALNGALLNIAIEKQFTNAAGNITFTGISGVDLNIYQCTTIQIGANGADRTIAFPASWKNHLIATSFVVTNGWYAIFTVEKFGSSFTNCAWTLIR